MIYFFIQTADEVRKIVSTNDATIQGILIAVILALGATVIYLYKQVQSIQQEYIREMRATNETLIKLNNSYNEFVNNMMKMQK